MMGPFRGASWHVEVVTRDEVGKELVLSKFKPFRLEALRSDPNCESCTMPDLLMFWMVTDPTVQLSVQPWLENRLSTMKSGYLA